MKYLSIDIETTGLDIQNHQILSYAFVLEDTNKNIDIEDLPYVYGLVMHKEIRGDLYAIDMNIQLIRRILTCSHIEESVSKGPFSCIVRPDNIRETMIEQLKTLFDGHLPEAITIAGKNVQSFDLPFIRNVYPDFPAHRRVIDPGSMYLETNDEQVPNLQECMKRAKIKGEVSHTALADARVVVQLIRHAMRKQND
ncbi:MAG: hypothetical protein BAJALOKI3v1_50065 [Promethearchaeota archaeon]|nr:MAG: hypothetical protein BAJALOKI3v1_50065 [Candidatus Lokiarchaeota archaeon]